MQGSFEGGQTIFFALYFDTHTLRRIAHMSRKTEPSGHTIDKGTKSHPLHLPADDVAVPFHDREPVSSLNCCPALHGRRFRSVSIPAANGKTLCSLSGDVPAPVNNPVFRDGACDYAFRSCPESYPCETGRFAEDAALKKVGRRPWAS